VVLPPTVTVCEDGDAVNVKSGGGGTLTAKVTGVEADWPPPLPWIESVKVPAGVVLEVVTVSVEVPDPPLTEAGLKLPPAPPGNPLTVSATALVKPPDGVTVTV